MTVLTLVEKLSCPRVREGEHGGKAEEEAPVVGQRDIRFRTKGKHSAATVLARNGWSRNAAARPSRGLSRPGLGTRPSPAQHGHRPGKGKKYIAQSEAMTRVAG